MPHRVLEWLRAPQLGPETYRLTRRVFLALLGLVYLAAFASLWVQLDGLIGSRGIAPAAELLERADLRLGGEARWRIPSLLWLGSSDGALHGLCAAGVAASLLLVGGVAPRAVLMLLWVLYLSLVVVGDVFLGYQWDALLIETGLCAIFFAPGGVGPRAAAGRPVERAGLWLLRWLLFRLIVQSGAVKLLSGDPTWWGLSALHFHYFTQPLPTWSSWYVHHLPGALHSISVFITLAIEIGLPVLVFAPRRARWLAFACFAALQLLILSTGNYGFFNWLTLALCVTLLDDASLRAAIPGRWRSTAPEVSDPPARRGWRRAGHVVFVGLAIGLIGLSATAPLAVRFSGAPAWLVQLQRKIAPLRSVNQYGLFAVMTTERMEIELEGSADGREWRPYVFRWKPGPPDRAPGFTGPHMPRLDWQMWFAALRGCRRALWFQNFMLRVLEGSESALGLLAGNPFPDAPPRYLRTPFYRYTFAAPGGEAWWSRQRVGAFCPPVRLENGRLEPLRRDLRSG